MDFLKAAKPAGLDDWHRQQGIHTRQKEETAVVVYPQQCVILSGFTKLHNTPMNIPKTLVGQFQYNFIKDFAQKFPQLLAEPNIIWSFSIKHHNIYLSLQM